MTARLTHTIGDYIGPGQKQYCVLDKLVSGGMGTVYRVENRLTGNIYAVKECDVLDDLTGRDLSRSQALEVFLSEGREIERLQHANIPRGFLLAHDGLGLKACSQCGMLLPKEAIHCPQEPADRLGSHPLQEIERRLYLFMDYIEGADALGASRHMPKPLQGEHLEKVKAWLRQAADALAFLHSKGLIHRDIKPENLRIHGDKAFVLDFGLVAEEPDTTKTRRLHSPTAFHGTKGYAAPEQVYGHPRRASDVFAFAMTFLHLATGEDPSHEEIAKKFCEKDPRELIPGLSENMADRLERSRQTRPESRPMMQDWVDALTPFSSAPAMTSASQTKPLRPAKTVGKKIKSHQRLRPGGHAGKGKGGVWQRLRPGNQGRVSGNTRSEASKLGSFFKAHIGKLAITLTLVVLTLWLWPSQKHLSFQAEAMPGAVIYKNTDDLRQGRVLEGGEILKVRHAVKGHEGNWLMVLSVEGRRTSGYMLRSKVFRGYR